MITATEVQSLFVCIVSNMMLLALCVLMMTHPSWWLEYVIHFDAALMFVTAGVHITLVLRRKR